MTKQCCSLHVHPTRIGHVSRAVLALCIINIIHFECAAAPLLERQRPHNGHGNGWKEFESLHRAATDLGAGNVKVSGLPSIIMDAISKRIGALVPSSPIYKAGCVVGSDQLVGPSSWRGTHDLLMRPNTDGHCRAPPLVVEDDTSDTTTTPANFTMIWENESKPPTNLPPVSEVYDTVFARRTHAALLPKENDPALSFWFLSFVNWFHDDNFRSVSGTDGSFTWSDASGLHMAQLYGHTPYRQRALRTMEGDGKMKTSSMGEWDYYPPLWRDVREEYPEFDMWTPTRGPGSQSSAANKTQEHVDANMGHYFAIGDPRFNLHAGHVVWTSIGLFIHNTACDILMEHTKQLWTDEDLFQRARVMTFHIIQKIRLQDFVSDSVSHVRAHTRVQYDPPVLRELLSPHFPFSSTAKPNYLEFNHVYQAWHSLIPDHLVLNGTNVPLHHTMWSPKLFHQHSISNLAAAFSDTRIAQYAPHNFPFFVRGVTEEAIKNERAQRLPSYNAYRQYVGLEPLSSFEQFAVDNPIEMAQLYDNKIDNVEFLTGIIADSNAELPGNFMGDTQLIIVSMLALQDVANNAVIQNPQLWSEEYLTEAGLQWIKDFEFRHLLEQVLLPSGNYPCPFQTTDSQDGESCLQPEEWRAPEEVGSCFMKTSRVCSYVGVDFTEWFFHENGYMRTIFLMVMISMGIITLLYVSVFGLISRLWPMEKADKLPQSESEVGTTLEQKLQLEENNNQIFYQRIRLCSLMINLILSVILCIPTTLVWFDVHSDPYWIQTFGESSYLIPHWCTILVGVHFVAEIPMRLAQWRFTFNNSSAGTASSIFAQLTVHHLGFFAVNILYIFAADVAVFKMGVTILTAWVWEWTMFLGFASVRVFDAIYETWRRPSSSGAFGFSLQQSHLFHNRAYQGLVLYGLPILICGYFATRIIETIVLLVLFVCGVQRGVSTSGAAGSFWALSVISCILVGLQYHAGFLLIGLYQRRKRPLSKWMALQSNAGSKRLSGHDTNDDGHDEDRSTDGDDHQVTGELSFASGTSDDETLVPEIALERPPQERQTEGEAEVEC